MTTPCSKPPPDPPADGKEPGAPSPPPPDFEGEDVLELCREAASMLGPNEMIHEPDFSLYGAMSALELMDAKMDKPPPALEVRSLCCVLVLPFWFTGWLLLLVLAAPDPGGRQCCLIFPHQSRSMIH